MNIISLLNIPQIINFLIPKKIQDKIGDRFNDKLEETIAYLGKVKEKLKMMYLCNECGVMQHVINEDGTCASCNSKEVTQVFSSPNQEE